MVKMTSFEIVHEFPSTRSSEISCLYCRPPQTFPNRNDRNMHISIQHRYKCTLCVIPFSSHYIWLHHFDVEHKNHCPICEVALPAKTERDKHIGDVHSAHPCSICFDCFDAEEDLTGHYNNPSAHPFRCNVCDKEFVCNRDFWCHCYEEHKRNCPFCAAEMKNNFNDKLQWANHLKTIHKFCPCSECHEVFQNDAECSVHYNDKHFNSRRHTCNYCSSYFPTANLKNKHIGDVHRIKCSICSIHFENELEFQHHHNDFHRFYCNYCARSFPQMHLQQAHTKLAHRLHCNICHKQLKNTDALKRHIDSKHAFKCFLCDKVMECKKEREMHIQLVHGVQCEICGLHFGTSELKQDHYNAVHQLRCELCERRFISTQELHVHYRAMHLKAIMSDDEAEEYSTEVVTMIQYRPEEETD